MLLADSHMRNFRKADQLSGLQVDRILGPLDVIRILQKEKISFVLVGAYGLMGWMKRARATEDVDVVVALRQVKKAVAALEKAFPELVGEDLDVVVRLKSRSTGDVAIDVMKPIQAPYAAIFKHTHSVVDEGVEFRVPSLEMALASKFAPLVSLGRKEVDKYGDAQDFALMAIRNDDIDWNVLEAIGESIFPGGGKEIVEKVQQAKAGQRLVF